MQRALGFALLALAAMLTPAAGFATSCSPSATRLCLQASRFGVEVAWTIPGGTTGVGHASPQTSDTGLFWFFSDSNLELIVKVLDGRAVNGHFWVYYGGLSDVEYTITVTDSQTGETETYHNPASQLASGADTSAFTAEPLAASGPIRFGMLGGTQAAAGGATTAATAGVPLRQGSELQANVTTEGFQWHPDVAIGSDGGFMVVWAGQPSIPQNEEDLDVYGRFFDAQGNPRGGEIRLNDHRAGAQSWPRVAAAPGGGYMAVWENGADSVIGRAYGVDGQPLTGEIEVSSFEASRSAPAITAADGGFVVAWSSSFGFAGIQNIKAQRLNARGERVGEELLIAGTSADFNEPRLAAWPGGGFVATWLEGFEPGEGLSIQARRFNAASNPVGETILVTATGPVIFPGNHQEAAPVVHPDGSFSIVWSTTSTAFRPTEAEGVFARRFSATGAALSGVIELRRGHFPQAPAAALLPSGDVLVLWYEAGRPLDPDGGVLARRFDSSWTPVGSEFRVNSFTQLLQTEPAVASDASGRMLAVWSSGSDVTSGPNFADFSQDGSNFGVFGQRFTTATCALASNQLCLNGRFRVDVQFTSPWSGEPEAAQAVPLTGDTGAFWFFGADNLELMIKVLDGRPVNGHFWVFAGALSDVAYAITVTDTETGQAKTYRNEQGQLASRADVEAF